MQIFDNQSAFRSLSAVPCPLEKPALPVSIWAGKGKNKHPPFITHPGYLSYLDSFFPFSRLNPLFCLVSFSCAVLCSIGLHTQSQLSERAAGLFAVINIKLSERTKRQQKKKRAPILSFIFFESVVFFFPPNLLALVSTWLSQTMSLERSK